VTMSDSRSIVRRHADVMGTVASVHVHDDVDPDSAHDAIAAVFDELERLEQMFSTFRPSSEISRVNRGELHLYDCSPEVIDVLDACTWLEHASGGAFRARRDGSIDPAGFVKGWAAERASLQLAERGIEHWYLSVGGDLLVHGRPRGNDRWTIAIADPTKETAVITGITVGNGAVATSGTAERGRHVWTADGSPADTYASVTVVGPSLTWADAFATTAFAMGEAGIDWVSGFDGYRVFAVTHDGALVNTIAA
jgi:thiamine biosynthesis lipoprotein